MIIQLGSAILGFVGGLLLVLVRFGLMRFENPLLQNQLSLHRNDMILSELSVQPSLSFSSDVTSQASLLLKNEILQLKLNHFIKEEIEISSDLTFVSFTRPTGKKYCIVGLALQDFMYEQLANVPSHLSMSALRSSHILTKKHETILSLPESTLMWYSLRDGYLPDEPLIPVENRNNDLLYIHTWYKGEIYSGFEAIFDSMLLTQDLQKSKFIFWLEKDWLNSSDERKVRIVQKYRYTPNRFIEFRIANVSELVKLSQTCWKDRPEFLLTKPLTDRTRFSSWTNVLRVLLLHVYGGIWIDADTIAVADFRVIHEEFPEKLVAGKWIGSNRFNVDSGITDANDTNRGYYNNNFLYLTKKSQREFFLDLSCQFRLTPIHYPRLNYTKEEMYFIDFNKEWKWRHDIPKGYKGNPLRIFNFWVWNDGLLRHCENNQNRCHLKILPLNVFDPTWLGTAELLSYCEASYGKLEKYTANYTEFLRLVELEGAKAATYNYWRSREIEKITWTIHNRGSSCRTLDTNPIGTFGLMNKMIRSSLVTDYRLTPMETIDFLTYDPLRVTLHGQKTINRDFFTIIVKSNIGNWKNRDAIRFQFRQFVQQRLRKSMVGLRLLFVVSVHPASKPGDSVNAHYSDKWNGYLITENVYNTDLLLVGPLDSELQTVKVRSYPLQANTKGVEDRSPIIMEEIKVSSYSHPWGVPQNYTSDGVLPSSLELGLVKWGYQFDSDYILFLYDDRIILSTKLLDKFIDVLEAGNHQSFQTNLKENIIPQSELTDLIYIPRDSFDPSVLVHQNHSVNNVVNVMKSSKLQIWNDVVLDDLSEKNSVGLLARRSILPMLLSSTNPLRKNFESRGRKMIHCHNMKTTVGQSRGESTPLTKDEAQTKYNPRCGNHIDKIHPLVDRIYQKPNKNTGLEEIRVRLLAASDLGFHTTHVEFFSPWIRLLYFSLIKKPKYNTYTRGKSWNNSCSNPFGMINSEEADVLSTSKQEHNRAIEEILVQKLNTLFILTDVKCPEWTILIHHYSKFE